VLHRLQAVRSAVDQIDRVLRAYVDQNGAIPAGDGKVWGPQTITQEQIESTSAEQLVDVLKPTLGDKAQGVVVATVGKGDLEAACKAAAPPRKGAEYLRRALSDLRQAGVVTSKQTTQYRVQNKEKANAA
jgi:hypothetical protein